jgi:hypothetical protein
VLPIFSLSGFQLLPLSNHQKKGGSVRMCKQHRLATPIVFEHKTNVPVKSNPAFKEVDLRTKAACGWKAATAGRRIKAAENFMVSNRLRLID